MLVPDASSTYSSVVPCMHVAKHFGLTIITEVFVAYVTSVTSVSIIITVDPVILTLLRDFPD